MQSYPIGLRRSFRTRGCPKIRIGALVDGAGRIVARSRAHEQFVGALATADLRERAVGQEGTWTGTTIEGTPVLSAFARVEPSGWKAAVGVPVSTVAKPFRQLVTWLLVMGGAALAASILLAALFGRQISRAMRDLVVAADSLSTGGAVRTPPSVLQEVAEIGDALTHAAADLRVRAEARELAERALIQSKDQLERVLDTSPVAIVETDLEGRFIYANRAAQEMLQLSSTQLDGRRYDAPAWKITSPSGEAIPNEDLPAARALRGETVRGYSHAVMNEGTSERIVLSVNAIPLRNAGRITGVLVAFSDITDRHEAEAALRAESARLETLNRTGTAIASKLDLEQIVQTVTDAGVALTSAAFGAFFYNVTQGTGERLTLYTVSGVPREQFSKFPMPRNTSVFAPTLQGASAVRSDDITADKRYGKNAPHRGMPEGHLPVRSYLAVPVVSRSGEAIGGLFFGHPEPARFQERHERLMTGIAAQAAIAIDNARLYGAAQAEIEARRASEEALRQSEERFRAAVRAVSGVIWTNNAAGEMNGEQPGWAALTGQLQVEYQGFGWATAVHPDDARPTIEAWQDALREQRTFVFEHRLRRHDGAWRHFAIRAVPVLDAEGCTREWVGVHTDVTEERAAREELRRFSERLEAEVEIRTRALAQTNDRLLDEIAQRERVEGQLRQAQKMEAIGQLTGGIAHDFNNLLSVILGSLQLLQRRADRAEGRSAALHRQCLRAAERAATLTQRLLAFSRRQPSPRSQSTSIGS